MNIHSLPTKVRDQAKSILDNEEPVAIVRMSGNVDGQTGEGYVVALRDRICLFTRSLGAYNYVLREMSYDRDIDLMVLRKEKYSLLMEMTVAGQLLVLKFSTYQEVLLQSILQRWSSIKGVVADATATQIVQLIEADDSAISPYAAATALLIFIATADRKISTEEDSYIKMFCNDQAVLGLAYEYYNNNELDDLLLILAKMDHQQKMCVLANVLDLSMVDGVLHASEQKMMWEYAHAVGLSDEEIGRVREIMLVKNHISVLCR